MLAGCALAAAFYMLLIDTTDRPELYAAAAVVLLGAFAFAAAREQGPPEASVLPRWLARAWSLPPRIVADILRVSAAAFRQALAPARRRGSLRTVAFARHTGEDGHAAGRRALAEAFGSLAPNTIVIGIDERREVLLCHQLSPVADADDAADPLRLR